MHTQSEDTVKRAAQHKKVCFDKNNRLKATYDGKCRDADKAEELSNKSHSNPQAKPKELTNVQFDVVNRVFGMFRVALHCIDVIL